MPYPVGCRVRDCTEHHTDPVRYQCDCGAVVCPYHWAAPSHSCTPCVVKSMKPKKSQRTRLQPKHVGRGTRWFDTRRSS